MSAATAGSPPRPDAARGDGALLAEPVTDAMGGERPSIRVTIEGSTAVLAVGGVLDTAQGTSLLHAATAAIAQGPSRLDIDLRELEGYTDEGAAALVACRALATELAEGLHYRTGRGPGREALLAAYQDVDGSTGA